MNDEPHVPDRVHLERLLPAPIDAVFAAWTDTVLMARWFAPTGYAVVEADVRVGGRFRLTMIDNDDRLDHFGEYLVVDPPRRLSFTWCSTYTVGHSSRVDVVLTARGRSTLLTLTHTGLPDTMVSAHGSGWLTIVDRLAGILSGEVRGTAVPVHESMQ
jgi:uncharacterized protein YndB with AHSA1/START domain